VVLSPLLAAIALLVKLDSPGSVIYGHERLGLRGRRFRCYKYRSMSDDAEQILRSDPALFDLYVQHHYKVPQGLDGLVTRTGRFLRRSSLDELLQLVNVLRGEMSLVGPRPIVPEELTEYDDPDLLLAVRPGMTGAWAANGRNRVGYPERARVEQDYVREWSLWRDLLLLVKTIPAVFRFDETR
jgi:lipopolysaccharide/colanic/teichoic acid biosynthesis glycosyltransferase